MASHCLHFQTIWQPFIAVFSAYITDDFITGKKPQAGNKQESRTVLSRFHFLVIRHFINLDSKTKMKRFARFCTVFFWNTENRLLRTHLFSVRNRTQSIQSVGCWLYSMQIIYLHLHFNFIQTDLQLRYKARKISRARDSESKTP